MKNITYTIGIDEQDGIKSLVLTENTEGVVKVMVAKSFEDDAEFRNEVKILSECFGAEVLTEKRVRRPPLGLTPRWVRSKERFLEVSEAIVRYYDANIKIPKDWIDEYNDLIDELGDHLP